MIPNFAHKFSYSSKRNSFRPKGKKTRLFYEKRSILKYPPSSYERIREIQAEPSPLTRSAFSFSRLGTYLGLRMIKKIALVWYKKKKRAITSMATRACAPD